MKIKIKTKNELYGMFKSDTGLDANERPLTFETYIHHLPNYMFGKIYEVVNSSLASQSIPFIHCMPKSFTIRDGEFEWYIPTWAIKAVIL